ncbi:MAG: EAL domain-containing protein, partial [Bacilli bacterium]|nr:EAL domain-containing protein [Bacilli bacterium]
NYAPMKCREIFDNLGVKSMYFAPIFRFNDIMAVIHFSSREEIAPLTQRDLKYLEQVLRVKEREVCLWAEREVDNFEGARKEALTLYGTDLAYEIDRETYNLTYLSPAMRKMYPDVGLGVPCYRILKGRGEPCRRCPLHNEGQDIYTSLVSLGSMRLIMKGTKDKDGLVVTLTNTSRMEENLPNREALNIDVQNGLLEGKAGLLLFVRIRNLKDAQSKAKLPSTEPVYKMVEDRLRENNLLHRAYRYDENTLVWLLYDERRIYGKNLALRIANVLNGTFEIEKAKINLILDYLLFETPIEIASNWDLESLPRTMFVKVENSGKGRIAEIGQDKFRVVLPRDYEVDAVKRALGTNSESMMVYVLPVDDSTSIKKPYLRMSMAVKAEDGVTLYKSQVVDAAESANLLTKLERKEIALYCDFINKHKELIDRYQGIVISMTNTVYLEPGFTENLLQILAKNKVDPSKFIVEWKQPSIRLHEKEYQDLYANLKEAGIGILIDDVISPVKFDVSLIRSHIRSLDGNVLSEKEEAALLQYLMSEAENGKTVFIKGIEEDKEVMYLKSTRISYLEGKYFLPYMKEDEFVKFEEERL